MIHRTLIALLLPSLLARADAPGNVLDPQSVHGLMTRVNAWQVAHPVMKEQDRNWERGTWYTGVMAAYLATKDEKFFDQAMDWGRRHDWQVGTEKQGANRLFCVQTWVQIYFIKQDPAMIAPAVRWLDTDAENSPAGAKVWYLEGGRRYADSLYGASALAMLAKATGDKKHLNTMHAFFWDVHKELFDPDDHLFYRDKRFIGQKTANGKKVYWSRGNGWVIAGIARLLEYLPADDPQRERYLELFRAMSAATAARQGADGLWKPNLADADDVPFSESSGTGFFCYALAWGINHGLLERDRYEPVVRKAWTGLASSVDADGKVRWGQPVGDRPVQIKQEQTHEYVTGTFLLAGSEVYRLAGAKAPPNAPAPGKDDRPLRSRSDLPRLKQADRAAIFAALGSFDDRGLADDDFVLKTIDLLAIQHIPGLAEAREQRDAKRALDCIARACRAAHAAAPRPKTDANVIAAANELLENRFTFYGEKHQLPASINWDDNPGTAHWGHDLNRFTYLEPLTQAYLATGDTRYSRKAIGLILDWIAKCDMGKCFAGSRYMWGSYLNNAIHCSAWSRCAATLLAADQVSPIELLRVLKSLHDQIAYLEIVTNGHAGNWPTIGCQGMLASLAVFPVLRDTVRFTDYCIGALKTQIAEQVLPDGVQDELTPHYHRVVVGNLLTSVRALRTMKRELDPQTMATLKTMVHYLQQTTVPDGSKQVAFNDSDPGSPGDIRKTLTELGLQEFLSPPEKLGPEVFPYAGVAFLRQRQDQGDLYLAFDAGPFGRAHQHEDRLGFWLFAYGRNFLVDPGRHLYDHSAKSYYDYLKSTAAHSTIRIDAQDQHSAGRRNTWIAKKPLELGWQNKPGETRASGVYDLGYGKDNAIAVLHRREIVFVKERFWVVFDSVEGEGEHVIETRLQFAPGDLRLEGMTARTLFDDSNLLLIAAPMTPFTDTHVEKRQEKPRGGWYSDSYGKIEPAPALSMSVKTGLPWRCATLLYPYRGKEAPKVTFKFDGKTANISSAETGGLDISSTLAK